MSKSSDSFITESMSNGEELTPLQAAQALELAMGNGDTAPAESIEPPADTAKEEPAPEPKADDVDFDSIDPDKAVLLARDGVHQIPFEQLVEARNQATTSQEQLAAANAELEEMRVKLAQAGTNNTAAEQDKQEQNIETAQAAIDAGVDPSLFGDFDEEGIAAGIEKLVAERVAAALAPMQQQTQKQQADAAAEAHWGKIFGAHEDADSVVQSVEFDTWRKSQPSFTQTAVDSVLQTGNADQVVELIDNFKQSQNSNIAPKANQPDLNSKADEVVKGIKTPTPTSLSDIHGHAGKASLSEQLENMGSVAALDVMQTMSPEQIERYLNSL